MFAFLFWTIGAIDWEFIGLGLNGLVDSSGVNRKRNGREGWLFSVPSGVIKMFYQAL